MNKLLKVINEPQKVDGLVFLGNGACEAGRRSKPIFEIEVQRTSAIDLGLVETITFNTEEKSLIAINKHIKPTHTLLLGPKRCKRIGAAHNRKMGAEALIESTTELRKIFWDEEADEARFNSVLIVHSTVKGTGGGGALPLGLMFREMGITVIFQSIRPAPNEVSTKQRLISQQVIRELLYEGFSVIQIDNGAAFKKSANGASVDEIYELLDKDMAATWQSWLFVTQNPGAADMSDLNYQIFGSVDEDAKGRLMVTGYASFPMPEKEIDDAAIPEEKKALEVAIKKAFDFWLFYFEYRAAHQALIINFNNQFWVKWRLETLGKVVDDYAAGAGRGLVEGVEVTPETEDNFYPIYGSDPYTVKSEAKHAFLAVIVCGPPEDLDDFDSAVYLRYRESILPASNREIEVATELPSASAVNQLNGNHASENKVALVPVVTENAEVKSEEVPTDETETKLLVNGSPLNEKLSLIKTSLVKIMRGSSRRDSEQLRAKVSESIQALDIGKFIEDNLSAQPEEVSNLFSDSLLALYAPIGKFDATVLEKISGTSSHVLTGCENSEELKILKTSPPTFFAKGEEILDERLALFELFGEDLISAHLAKKKPDPKPVNPIEAMEKARNGSLPIDDKKKFVGGESVAI